MGRGGVGGWGEVWVAGSRGEWERNGMGGARWNGVEGAYPGGTIEKARSSS